MIATRNEPLQHTTWPATADSVRIDTVTRGHFDPAQLEHARHLVQPVATTIRGVTGPARMRITDLRYCGGSILVQINIRLGDVPARVQVSEPTLDSAAAAAAAGLDRRIRLLSESADATAWPELTRPLLAIPGRAPITRTKEVRLAVATRRAALRHMLAMDYDAHMFTDRATHQQTVVHRLPAHADAAGARGLRAPRPATAWVFISRDEAPITDTDHAAEQLADRWLSSLFYTDRVTGRSNLLYRRHDVDLCLIVPRAVD